MTSRNGARVLLAAIGVLAALFSLEIGLRTATGIWTLANFTRHENRLRAARGPIGYDPRLGWTSKPGRYPAIEFGDLDEAPAASYPLHVLDDGIRSNGPNPPPIDSDVVLAVGGSDTFGEEVSDGETWPSFLEAFSGKKVLNAGVPLYSVDQAYLRAEALIPKYKPGILVLGFVYEDVKRSLGSSFYSGAWKPYFLPEGERELSLRGVPVPRTEKYRWSLAQNVLGHSLAAHKALSKIFGARWTQPIQGPKEGAPNDLGPEIARRIFRKLDDLAEKNGVRQVYVVFMRTQSDLYDTAANQLTETLRQDLASSKRTHFIETRPMMLKAKDEGLLYMQSLSHSYHWSREGNDRIARELNNVWEEKKVVHAP